jgi:periplasmic divalent cation tolerance protein
MPKQSKFRVVLVTCGSLSEARKISRAIVGMKLAACVNISKAAIESIYRWGGKVETAKEHLLIIKTSAGQLRALEREVVRRHSYETPEFLVLNVAGGSKPYLDWLARSVHRR